MNKARAWAAGAATAGSDIMGKVKAGFNKFMKIKIGGKVPAWCCAAAALVLIIVLIIVLAAGGNGPATSPKDLVSLMEKAYKGDAKAAWNMTSPYEREDEFDNDYSTFKKYFDEEEAPRLANNKNVKYTFIGYEKNGTYKKGDYEDNRTEDGELYYKVEYTYHGEKESDFDSERIVKIDDKWYMRNAW